MKNMSDIGAKHLFRLLPLAINLAIPTAISNQVIAAQSLTPPLLMATDYQAWDSVEKYLVSEKLDGVRAYWNGQALMTRSGRFINAPEWFSKNFPAQSLDGELWIKRNQFEKLSGIIRKKSPIDSEWRQIKYMVFDLPNNPHVFTQRYQQLTQLIKQSSSQSLHLVKQQEIPSVEKLTAMLADIIAKGGEGLMLHKKESLYQAKRSRDLQKLKPFSDAEARVIGYIPGKGKYSGMMGALKVINTEGKIFRIGSGFNLQERQSPPPINSQITYRYRGKTSNNLPRFATFLRQRNLIE